MHHSHSRFRPAIECLESRQLLSARVLVFSHTVGFRHDSIADGIATIRQIGEQYDIVADATENPAEFTDANLAQYNAVVFLLTTGDVLNPNQQVAFERYIQAGGGYLGIHSAADTEYGWAWYGRLMGAYFQGHPEIQAADSYVEDHNHPSTLTLPDLWRRTDEWYNYRTNPRDAGVTVLAVLDESTYQGGTMGTDHPISWYHHFDGGRSWYTGMGHTRQSYQEPLFVEHLTGGLLFAVGDPLYVAAVANSPEQVEVRWSDVSLDPSLAYYLERTTDGIKFEGLATLKAPALSYSDTTVSPETWYGYRLWAFGESGSLATSNVAWVITPGLDPGPGGDSALLVMLLERKDEVFVLPLE